MQENPHAVQPLEEPRDAPVLMRGSRADHDARPPQKEPRRVLREHPPDMGQVNTRSRGH